MINRILSSVASFFTVWFFVQAYFRPNDPQFLLKSNSMPVNLFFLLLAVGSVCLSFLAYKLFWQAYLMALVVAVSLGSFSLFSLIDASISSHLPFGLWDYFLLMQFSIIYAIGALDIEHRPIPLRLPRAKFDGLVNTVGDLLNALPQAEITKPTRLQKG